MKRAVDVIGAMVLLAAASPLCWLISVAIRWESPGPVLHRSIRAGRYGTPFELLKFRSMVVGAAAIGPGVTVGGDPRVTRVGRLLRWSKLDELPQLVNVLRGEMSLVGPRPEDPRYVALYDERQRRILDHRPGITSPASLMYRHEERILAGADDPEAAYRTVVMPAKLDIDLAYFDTSTVGSDLALLAKTARRVISRS